MKTDIKLKRMLICYSLTVTHYIPTCTMSQNEVFVDEENFKSLVCRRLVECGWMDEVTMLCKEKLKDRLSQGQTSITEDDLFNDVAPDARRMLPDTIKRELKVKVQNKLLQAAGYFDETESES